MRKQSVIIVQLVSAALGAVLSGCATAPRSELRFTQDVSVTIGDREPLAHKEGETLTLDSDKPVLVEAPGKVGVLILPAKQEPTKTEITLRQSDQWAGPRIQDRIDNTLNEVVGNINDIQMLLTAKRLPEAKLAIDVLKSRYPRISQLGMLEASYYMAQGDKTRAALILSEIIRRNPGHPSAKQFLQSLTRGVPSRVPSSKGEP